MFISENFGLLSPELQELCLMIGIKPKNLGVDENGRHEFKEDSF